MVTVRDAGLAALTRAVNAYARRVQAAGPNAVGFFYYSGHGAADAGTNYLIPVDVKTTETGELWDQSLRLTEITRKLKAEAGNATHFVVFDACRNTLKLTRAGSRALVQSKGFVPVAQESGMLIAYATAEGELASDVGAGAGPYAKVLAEEIVKPGVEAVTMFRSRAAARARGHQAGALSRLQRAGRCVSGGARSAEAWTRSRSDRSGPRMGARGQDQRCGAGDVRAPTWDEPRGGLRTSARSTVSNSRLRRCHHPRGHRPAQAEPPKTCRRRHARRQPAAMASRRRSATSAGA